MLISERDFSTFKPGDNPYELGDAAVRILAGYTGIELGATPNLDEVRVLTEAWGPEGSFEHDLRAYVEGSQNPEQTRRRLADTVNHSGVLSMIPPRNVQGDTETGFDRLIIPGGDAGETLAVAVLGQQLLNSSGKTLPKIHADEVVLVGSGREINDRAETEAELLHTKIGPRFREEQGLRVVEFYNSDPDVKFRQMACGDLAGRLAIGKTLLLQFAPASHTFGELLDVVPNDQLFFASGSNPIGSQTIEQGDKGYYYRVQNAAAALAKWVQAVHCVNSVVKIV